MHVLPVPLTLLSAISTLRVSLPSDLRQPEPRRSTLLTLKVSCPAPMTPHGCPNTTTTPPYPLSAPPVLPPPLMFCPQPQIISPQQIIMLLLDASPRDIPYVEISKPHCHTEYKQTAAHAICPLVTPSRLLLH